MGRSIKTKKQGTEETVHLPSLAPSTRGGVFPDASIVETLGVPCSVLTGGDAFRRHDAPDRRIGPDRTNWFANG